MRCFRGGLTLSVLKIPFRVFPSHCRKMGRPRSATKCYNIGLPCSVIGQHVSRKTTGRWREYGPPMNSSMTELDKDEQFYRDTESIAFPKLDDRQLAMLEPLGARRIVRRGELGFKAGQRDLGLTVVLGGELEVFESRDGQEQILATAGPRGFVGDVATLMGTAAVASARGKADESEILVVPAGRFRQARAALPRFSEPIVRAFIMRRQRLKRDREFAGLRILSQDGSREGRQLDDFLDKNHIPHRVIDFQSEY